MQPIGYRLLCERYGLNPIPHFVESFIQRGGSRRLERSDGREKRFYPHNTLRVGDDDFSQLEFAFKHEGLNLGILAPLFRKMDPETVRRGVMGKPFGTYSRKIWYLYEFLAENTLDFSLPEGRSAPGYLLLASPNAYFTARAIPSPRHRISDNLPGSRLFCPMIRRTPLIESFIAMRLDERCRETIRSFPQELLNRAINYLYLSETKTSFEIEGEKPGSEKTARFVALLKNAGKVKGLDEKTLVSLQKSTVDPRYAAAAFRTVQNFVGHTLVDGEIVDYVCPKPEDVGSLMEGLRQAYDRMLGSGIHPVVVAGAISFAFVLVHPFEDGNDRLHRFLIHHILSRTGFAPPDLVFPVSAVMLAKKKDYDALLETFSVPLTERIDYAFDRDGFLKVSGETADLYRYPDMTRFVEGLFGFVQKTVEARIPGELRLLEGFDRARPAILEVVDMPDRKADLFIRLVVQGNGSMNGGKRKRLFGELTDEEVERMTAIVREAFGITP